MDTLLNKLPFASSSWFMYLRMLVRHFLEDNCTQKAASLTYTTLLSLVPMIAVFLVIFSTVPALESTREQVEQAIYSNLLPSSSRQVSEYINSFAENYAKFTVVGISVLLFTTVTTLITIETAFNQIWRVEEQTGGVKSTLRYVVMVVGIPVILSIAFIASSAIQSVDFLNRQVGGYGINWVIWGQLVSFIVTVAGFIAMYWFIPKVQVPLKNAAIAGIVIAILFELVKRFFGLAITNFTSYEAIYGAFAALPIFLLWLYISWNLILIGVEISYTLTIFETDEVPVRHPLLSLLDMLNLIYKNYKENKSTSEDELREVLGRKELPKWHTYISQLVDNGLITQTDKAEYTLRTNLASINLWQFYKTLPYPLPIKEELIALKEVDYDPWHIEIYQQLKTVETTTRHSLNMPLAHLFETAPIRPKREVMAMASHEHANSSRIDGVYSTDASFDNAAKKTQTTTDADDELLIPDGEAAFTAGTFGKIARLTKKARHFIGRGRGAIADVRRNFR